MDFVQRNLINERNNLQIELAKAKLLIAELSEEINSAGEQEAVVADRAYAQKRKPTGMEQAALIRHAQNDSNANARVKIANQSRPKPMSEQAKYISDLENVIISIAEQLGVHPNDLLNELNIRESNWGSDSQYGEAAQRRRNGNGMTDAEMNAPTEAARKARDLKRGADDVRAQTRAIENDNRRRRDGGYGVPTGLGSNL